VRQKAKKTMSQNITTTRHPENTQLFIVARDGVEIGQLLKTAGRRWVAIVGNKTQETKHRKKGDAVAEVVSATKPAPKAKKAKPAPIAFETSELRACKEAYLRDIARSHGVRGFTKMTKKELIKALKPHAADAPAPAPKKAKAKKSTEPKTPKRNRLDVMVELLERKDGASVDEIIAALLIEFPKLTKKHGLTPDGELKDAEESNYKTYANVMMSHLRAGRCKSKPEYAGRIERFGERGAYRYRVTEG